LKTTVFIGGGRITSALIAGLRLAKYPRPIIVHDRHREKLLALKLQCQVRIATDFQSAVEAASLLILAARPESMPELVNQITRAHTRRSMTAVSLAAGIPLAVLETSPGGTVQWARAMPSPVCRTGRGLTALAFGKSVSPANRKEILKFFSLVGRIVEIPERQFDAFTVTFSSSHGYHSLASLIEAAQAAGLKRETAALAASHALGDAVASWRSGTSPLDELMREAATPGGIAAAVMESLDRAGYHEMLTTALRRGLERAKKNARLFSQRKSG